MSKTLSQHYRAPLCGLRMVVEDRGQLLVEALKIQGADMVFGVPGESYLAVLEKAPSGSGP